jgi:outer membrane receptor protein involved in Fe transport
MRKGYRFMAVWIVASLLSIAAFAQNITITGTVRNAGTGEVVPAVSVLVKGTNVGTFTNSDGAFSLSVEKLPVTLVVSSVGFEQMEIAVSDASKAVEVDFKPVSTLGQEVVVAATRTPTRILESPVTVERMSSATIRNVPAPNYYEAIANLKGVDMHTASLTFRTVTTRGFVSSGNTRLNQLIDGMDNQAPGLNFSVGNIIGPNELDVDNVELLAGASSALYGSGGLNGTLLINSKNPFKYQGLSFNIKQGIMHVDGKQRSASPYYDWSLRWAKAINNKFAFKFSAALVKANDWQADDYRNKQQIGVLSSVVGGNRQNDPNFNGVNIYGDEASANMLQFANLLSSTVRSNPLSQAFAGLASSGGTTDISVVANSILGNNPSSAQINGFLANVTAFANSVPGLTGAQRQAYVQAMQAFVPVNLGLNNGTIPNQNVSRTGYEEKNLVDYNTINAKFNAALHYMINNNIEASLSSYFGTGTTVYTGADRYALRNLKIAQHKLEVRGKTWFVRGYTTQENAGGSYNATALGVYINDQWKTNQTWFTQYVAAFSESRRLGGTGMSDQNAHINARGVADAGRYLPGTPAFENAKRRGQEIPISQGGALFLDKTDLYSGEGQLNLSDALDFSDQLEVVVGAQWKQWALNSEGTLFDDGGGVIRINETGGYIQLRKKFFNDFLTINAAGRYDKQTNFDGKFTPRFTALFRVAKDNNIRVSYQTGYRFPTNQNQYIDLLTGAGLLIGCLPEQQTKYGLNGNNPGYTAASVLAYRASGNPANTNLLIQAQYREVKPETVNSFEVGYKGILGGKLLLDAYAYYSINKNFVATIGVAQSAMANPSATDLYSPFTTRNVSYVQNAQQDVKAIGWGVSAEYQLGRGFNMYGNLFSDQLQDVPAGFVSFFNAPKYRWNLGLRNDNVYKGIGFNVVVRWQDNNYYEGTFVSGTLPYFTWVDAQVSYRMPKTKSVFRIGGTNLGNSYYRTGFGSPYVGGLYYVSYGYNLF